MAKIAQYMTTMVINATTGMLVDHTAVRVAFSVSCSEDRNATPYAVIFMSPPVKWKTKTLL